MRSEEMDAVKGEIDRVDISAWYFTGKILGFWLRWFFFICIGFIILYPLIYMLTMAFRDYTDFYNVTVVWITKTYTLGNFKFLLQHLNFGEALLHTLIITSIATVIQLIVCSTVGYGFGRFRFYGEKLLFALVIFTIIVPQQMRNLSSYMLMNDLDFFGIFNFLTGKRTGISLMGPASIILPVIFGQGIRSGLYILIFKQIYAALPKEIEEAALIDGCSHFRTYRLIMIPNASNAFLISGIFNVVWYWTDYYSASTFLSEFRTIAMELPDLRNAAQLVLSASEQNAYRYIPLEQAACLILILPLLIAFLVIQKHFSNSIDKTGLVG